MNTKPSKHHTIYYNSTTDDVVKSKKQDFILPDDYQIIKHTPLNYLIRFLASGFAYLFTYGVMHVKVIGRDKLSKYKDEGYFVYGNHTQMVNDVFMPLTLFGWKNYYAIANQANWGIPVIGKTLLPYGGLSVGKNIKQAIKLLKAVKTLTKENAHIVIYPEAHVWPYYTGIRLFPETSFNFPVQADKASFVMTTTYQKCKFGKHPNITVYIDGPFFPDSTLTKKEQQKKLSHKFKNIIAQTIINLDTLVLMAHTQIKNKHRAKGPQHGAIVTTNHFKQTDSLPIKKLANRWHKKLYVVIEDSNLKLPGFFGFLMNNINAIPIVQSYQYLGREFPKHLQKVFDKKGWVLIYPEQEIWYNYRKPRPLQKGAYYYAAKAKVPIISCFVEIQDLPEMEKNSREFYKTRYILHVLPTIYPVDRLTVDQNAKRLRDIDYMQKKKAYEKAYGKKLTYDFDYDDIAGYVKE